ncbi:unnamed protein product [Phytomonas sp. Hart1]|nr:unnamed protein product [Phytomonas sp. Hart1]|eukprot:CCW69916.1 unnamed protein product [Phytomonas sp. isolate Hart1]
MISLEEEIEMFLNMYGEECTQSEDCQKKFLIHLPFEFELEITLTGGYFEENYPTLFVKSAPNVQLAGVFSTVLHQRMREEIPLGTPMLVHLVNLAQILAQEVGEERQNEKENLVAQQKDAEDALLREKILLESSAIPILSGEPVVDRRSKFLAHLAPVRSVQEAMQVVNTLRDEKHIMEAAHPTIWAYRFMDKKGLLHQDSDDDGESGASIKMLFLLDHLKVDGFIVVVTRWWGGILLGPDRFKHIMSVTKDILLTIPSLED